MQGHTTRSTAPKITWERVKIFIEYYSLNKNETFSDDAVSVFTGYIRQGGKKEIIQLFQRILPILSGNNEEISERNKQILRKQLTFTECLYFEAIISPSAKKQMTKLKDDSETAKKIEAEERVEKVVKLYRFNPAYFNRTGDKEESVFQEKFMDALEKTALAHVLGTLNPIQYTTQKKNELQQGSYNTKLSTTLRESIKKEMSTETGKKLEALLQEYERAIGNLTSDPSGLEKFFTANPIMTTFILDNFVYLEKCARLYQSKVEETNTQFCNDYIKNLPETIEKQLKSKMSESEASTVYSKILGLISVIDKGLPSHQYKQQVEMVVSNQLHFHNISDLVVMKLKELNIPKESVKDALLKDLVDKIKLKSKDVLVFDPRYVECLNKVINSQVSAFVNQQFSGNSLGKTTVTHFAPSNPLKQMMKRLNSKVHEKIGKTLEDNVDLKNLIELFLNCKIDDEKGREGVDSFVKVLLELCAFENPTPHILEMCLQFKDSPISKFFKTEDLGKIHNQVELLAKNLGSKNTVRG